MSQDDKDEEEEKDDDGVEDVLHGAGSGNTGFTLGKNCCLLLMRKITFVNIVIMMIKLTQILAQIPVENGGQKKCILQGGRS